LRGVINMVTEFMLDAARDARGKAVDLQCCDIIYSGDR
jgi:hypothetical protein